MPVNAGNSGMISKKADLSENLEMGFLRDINQYPESGIAQRYKRLGISVRQGQKLKSKIFNGGLIEESIQTTKTGRIKVIKLTEKAKVFVSSAE